MEMYLDRPDKCPHAYMITYSDHNGVITIKKCGDCGRFFDPRFEELREISDASPTIGPVTPVIVNPSHILVKIY